MGCASIFENFQIHAAADVIVCHAVERFDFRATVTVGKILLCN